MGTRINCWEMQQCPRTECPAYGRNDTPCWYVDGTKGDAASGETDKLHACDQCPVYRKGVRDEVGQLANSFINMTNRIKLSQAQLRESEGEYRSLFHGGPNPIFVVDRGTLEILDANPSAEVTYGYGRQDLIGRSFTDLGSLDYVGGKLLNGFPGKEEDIQVVNPKVRHFKKGNNAFFVNIHATPSRYQDREALIVATTDITEMIEKDTQLIQASKMTTLGEMSAGIAHELNQPLNAIKMGSEFLKMMVEDERTIEQPDLYAVVDEISTQVDRVAEIIHHLRDFGRKADFTKEKIHINRPIRSVLEILRKQLRLQNIHIELDLEETIPPVLAHHNRLEQVIFNLITNARDAINQRQEAGYPTGDRTVSIRSFSKNDQVFVTVADTGVGISASVRERIFEAFFTTKEMGEGMGLGLSITYGIVGDYDGTIDIDSSEGVGTTFTLTFPRSDAP